MAEQSSPEVQARSWRLSRVFTDRTVATKTSAIAAVGLVGMVAIGGIYGYGLTEQSAFQRVADQATEASLESQRLQIDLLEMRRAEKDFLIRHDDKYAKRNLDFSASARNRLGRLVEQLAASDQKDLVTKAEPIGPNLRAYVEAFESVVDISRTLGFDQDSGLEGRLRGSVHAIETRLNEVADARLTAAMLMLRRHEKDFMLRRATRYGDLLRRAARRISVPVFPVPIWRRRSRTKFPTGSSPTNATSSPGWKRRTEKRRRKKFCPRRMLVTSR